MSGSALAFLVAKLMRRGSAARERGRACEEPTLSSRGSCPRPFVAAEVDRRASRPRTRRRGTPTRRQKELARREETREGRTSARARHARPFKNRGRTCSPWRRSRERSSPERSSRKRVAIGSNWGRSTEDASGPSHRTLFTKRTNAGDLGRARHRLRRRVRRGAEEGSVTGASEVAARHDRTEEHAVDRCANPSHRSAWGVVKTRHAPGAPSQEGASPAAKATRAPVAERNVRGCSSLKLCGWQTSVVRISDRSRS